MARINEDKPDIVAMTRELLKGITVNFSGDERSIEDSLEENEKRALYADAHSLLSNPAFKMITRYLINVQGNYCVKEAQNMGEVAFGRATINGIFLFQEEVKRLSSLHKEELKREEEYDPHAAI